MRYSPSLPEYLELARNHSVVPIYRQLLGDTLTPVTAFHKLQGGDWAFLFESVVGGERLGRYSFLGADPFLVFQAWHRTVQIEDRASRQHFTESNHPDPMRLLEEWIGKYRAPNLPGLPRFCGGAVGYAGYDTVRYVEHLEHPPDDDRKLPDLSFALYDRMVIFDHINKTIAVVAHAHVPPKPQDERSDSWGSDAALKQSYDAACRRVDELVERLRQQDANPKLTDIAPAGKVERDFQSNFAPGAFEKAVEKSKEYIKAGDIFQVVLSQRLMLDLGCDPFEVYRTLRVVNPSPFMFFLRTPEVTLVGSSPEIMCRVVDRQVTVRPLAGTRPRGASDEEDRKLAEELLADPKERAEHVMLVDLGRNDVGRVAKFGSVKLSDVMVIERYSHVMHITSNVTATLKGDLDAFDALKACHPAGTVSGAPKVRAMQIIDELEPTRRGPYAGAVGYIDYAGNMDTCITLRTLVVQGDKAYIQAGAGIVADSIPASEYQETLNKARGLLKAIEITRQRVQGSL